MSAPKCPKCGDNRRAYESGDREWWCSACGVAFDDHPNEGGDYSDDPTKRIERQEAWEARKRARRNRQKQKLRRG